MYVQVEGYQNTSKPRYCLLAFTLYKAFLTKTKRGLELAFLPYFLHDFWIKMFLTFYSINWPNLNASLILFLEILGYMCSIIIFRPACDVINFEINLGFLIKPFSDMTKKSGQKFKDFKNEKSFYHETRSTFHHFYRVFNCQKLSLILTAKVTSIWTCFPY